MKAPGEFGEQPGRIGGAQNPAELGADAFHGKGRQGSRRPLHGGKGGRRNLKAQAAGKAHAAQRPQRILAEARVRVAAGGDQAAADVRPAAQRIHHTAVLCHAYGIHKEVAAYKVVLQRHAEAHPVRVPRVGIIPLAPVGGNFHQPAGRAHPHRAKAEPGNGEDAALKQVLNCLRRCAGGHVKVVGNLPQQQIADTATHQVCLIPRGTKPVQHVIDRLWHGVHSVVSVRFHPLSFDPLSVP